MIRVDISRAIPATAIRYLVALMPGLFFEIAILIANPRLIAALIAHVRTAYPFSHYLLLIMALFVAFVIGNASMLFVGQIQRFIGVVYRLKARGWKAFCRWKIMPFLNWMMQRPNWNRRLWFMQIHRYIAMQIHQFPIELLDVRRCWGRSASVLLEKCYGIKQGRQTGAEAGVWYSVLGKPTPQDIRGDLLMIATHAMGWSGLVAAHFASSLKEPYYFVFSSFLILMGLFHDWRMAKWHCNPVWSGLVKIRNVLTEIEKQTKYNESEFNKVRIPGLDIDKDED